MRIPLLNSLLLLLLLAFGQQLVAQCTPDTEPPTADCLGSFDVVLSLNQTATLTAAALDDGSSDNCTSQLSFFLNDGLPAANLPATAILDFDADDIGTHDVTLWVVDEAGNHNHCITQVQVKDDCNGGASNPSLACNALITIPLTAGDSVLVYPGLFLEGNNYCSNYEINTFMIGVGGPPGVTADYFGFDMNDAGAHYIKVRDLITGNSCWTELLIKVGIPCPIDTVPPIASCSLFQQINVALGDVTLNAEEVEIYSSDDCTDTLSLRLEAAPASVLPPAATSVTFGIDDLGTNELVLWTVDEAGNFTTCTAFVFVDTCSGATTMVCNDITTVSVLPNGTPTLLYPLDITEGGPYCENQLGIRVIDINSTPDPHVSLDTNHIGQHTVLVTHLISGNICWGILNVEVLDCANETVAPIPYCKNGLSVGLLLTGQVEVYATDIDAGSYDNCTGPGQLEFRMERAPASATAPINEFFTFTAADAGPNEMVMWVIDEVGNEDYCQITVEIVDCNNDVVPPIITAPADHVYSSLDFEQFVFDLNDNASLDAIFGAANAADACGTATVTQSNQVAYNLCNRITQITRSFIAWDEAGNISAIATQVIDVYYKNFIYLPSDHYPTDPGDPAEVEFLTLDTSILLASSYQDLVFDLDSDGNDDLIERTWSIVNWCMVDLQQPFQELPRLDTDNDGNLGDGYTAISLHNGVFYPNGSVPQNGGLKYLQKIHLTEAACLFDSLAPVPICVNYTVAQFAVHGPNLTFLPAEVLNNASYDNCAVVNFAVEIAAVPSQTMPTTTTANFTVVGVYENVYLWVADAAGNAQYCNVTVEIIPPKCTPDNTDPYFTFVPLDTVIHADDLAAMNLDPQDYQQLNQYFGEAEVWDYCGFDTVVQSVNFVTNFCGGIVSITRDFLAIDESGNTSAAQQTITVQTDFSFNLPADFHPGDAGVPQELTFLQGNGTQLAVSYYDEAFDFNCDAQPDFINRTWTLINWCGAAPVGTPTTLPRLDLDNDGSPGDGYTAWENEGIIYRLENGLPVQDFGVGNGIYSYTQIIRYNFDDTVQYNLTGIVFRDADASCDLDAGEPLLANWKVKALGNNSGRYYHATTNASGIYVFDDICASDTELEISLDISLNYGQTCPTTWTVALAHGIVAEQKIPVQLDTDCALMEVSLATPYLRRCFANNYTVSYCNYSASLMEDTWVEVSLDSFMEYNNSSIPGILLSGNTYSFATGDLAAGQCENFTINFDLSCEAELGQTHCTEAHILPDTLCPQNASWTGANIEVEGRCENEQVILTIRNTGTGAMAGPQEYIVVEDVLMFDNGNFNLGAGQSMQLAPIPANGATWRLEAEQAPAHPYPGNVSVSLEGCDGINELGLVNLFPVENPNPFIAVDCQENQGSFDPNDKRAIPVGYGDDHFIYRNTDIEYLIRFQNTGTDTAFTVVVEDALSQYLDPTSIRPGASSHAYSYDLKDGNTVRFTFENILLPDSSQNLAGSQGFVKFFAKQKPNLALGSIIENTAAIYFDFNEPITTNRVFHTIGENFIEVVNSVNETANGHGQPTVFPNPAFGAVTFALPLELGENAKFILHDQLGKLAYRQAVSGNKFVFERKGMTPGIYFYSIENEGVVLFTGKVVLK